MTLEGEAKDKQGEMSNREFRIANLKESKQFRDRISL